MTIRWWPGQPHRHARHVLGVNLGPHDSAAALLVDGRVVAAMEEERLTRNKYAHNELPVRAVEAVLRLGGINPHDVDVLAVGWDHPLVARDGQWPGSSELGEGSAAAIWRHITSPRVTDSYDSLIQVLHHPPTQFVAAEPNIPTLAFVEHHAAHAWSAVFSGAATPELVIVADGRGEERSTSVYRVEGLGAGDDRPKHLRRVADRPIAQSFGNFYALAAEWAGLGFWGAGKLMGLAAYGGPRLFGSPRIDRLDRALRPGLEPDSRAQFFAQRDALRALFEQRFPFQPNRQNGDVMDYATFAFEVQGELERQIDALLSETAQQSYRIALAGGVAENSVLVGRLLNSGWQVDVPVLPYDAGVSIGAALAVWTDLGHHPARVRCAGLGRTWTDAEVDERLTASSLASDRLVDPSDLTRRVARMLSDGKVVGWFQGRAEVGRRALGRRSILADPRDRSVVTRVNRLKGREQWRPLAPSILVGDFTGVLDTPHIPNPASFMLATFAVRPEWQPRIPACVHVDGTARPQAVDPNADLLYASLLRKFGDRTGIPVLLNTSFNGPGEPIVETPDDAIHYALRLGLDALVVGSFVTEMERAR